MNWAKIWNNLKDHSGTICAIGAVCGVFVTAYFSGKAAVEVHEIQKNPELKPKDTKETIKVYGKAYAKTAVSAVATTALIIGSDRAHVSKEVALTGAAVLWKDKFVELDKKVTEKLGTEEAYKIHREILDDEIKKHPYSGPVVRDDGQILVYEPYTEQYFYTSREKIAWAMLEANKRLMTEYDVRLNYIIKMLGGVPKPIGDKIGWNWENETQDYVWSYYGGPWIEIMMNVTKHDEWERDVVCLFYQVDPDTQEPEDMIYSE